jgi:hypothetical protein
MTMLRSYFSAETVEYGDSKAELMSLGKPVTAAYAFSPSSSSRTVASRPELRCNVDAEKGGLLYYIVSICGVLSRDRTFHVGAMFSWSLALIQHAGGILHL